MYVASSEQVTIGEKVAFYRRRRGMTHATLAGLVGRTTSWLEKVENGRAPLDRVSVIRDLARALDLSLHDLLPDDAGDVDQVSRAQRVPALRDLVLSYRAVNPRFAASAIQTSPVSDDVLRRSVHDIWSAYQDSRFGYVVMRLNSAIPDAYLAVTEPLSGAGAHRSQAQLYHVAASVLVKLGDLDLARLCSERGDIAAQNSDDAITRTSLQRSVAHTLLSNGDYENAVAVVRDGIVDAAGLRSRPGLSVLGTLLLVGATASARAGERTEAATFLRHASRLAERVGRDTNDAWTSFGPTNVAIHEVTVAAELGDIARAVEIGRQLDVSHMPCERRVRHELEVARALTKVGRMDDALRGILAAEVAAPEQVRGHFLTHELVQTWIRATRTAPPAMLVALARRLGLTA